MNVFRGIRPRLTNAFYQCLGYGTNGRGLRVYPEDRFLVGYPKSGNTWLNFLVAGLLMDNLEDLDFFSIEDVVADIYFNSAKRLSLLSRPRVLKSHEPYDERYLKVVYIVRDPRDVVISYYHHHCKQGMIDSDIDLDTFVSDFVRGRLDGLGPWGEHVAGWLTARASDDDFLLIRYEDIKLNPIRILNAVAHHLNIPVSNARLEQAVEWASMENLRRLEAEAVEMGHPCFKGTRKDIPFVRKGKAGGWKETLSPDAIEMIENAWGDVMNELGYLPDHASR